MNVAIVHERFRSVRREVGTRGVTGVLKQFLGRKSNRV